MTTKIKTPALRFPEFEGEWEEKKLGEIAHKINSGKTPLGGEKTYEQTGIIFIRSQNVLENKLSLDSLTYISEEINNTMRNSIVEPNDILLNITGGSLGRSCVVPSNFTTGNVNQHVCIIRLDKKYNSNFIQPIFASSKGQKDFFSLQTGSGREGLNFQSIKGICILVPSLPEQQKIANFLSTVDEQLQSLKERKNKLEEYKKGMMQKIFSQQLRFKDKDGNEYADWEDEKLNKVLDEHKDRNTQLLVTEVFSVAKEKGVINQIEHLGRSYASDDISNYKVVYPNDIIYTKSPTSDFPYGIIKQNKLNRDGVVSVLYGVFKPKTEYIGYLLDAYFSSGIRTYNYLNPLVQKGAKNTMNIGNSAFLDGATIALPSAIEEQHQIADFLSAIDDRISFCNEEISKVEEYRKGLLQQMFV